jgi:hypothetical protein
MVLDSGVLAGSGEGGRARGGSRESIVIDLAKLELPPRHPAVATGFIVPSNSIDAPRRHLLV